MNTPSFKVLVAEDEALQLNSLAALINRVSEDFEVVALAQTGLQALEKAERHMLDLVITDIQMPQMSGIELIEALRGRLPGSKFIIISGYSEFEYAKKAIALKVAAYLLKPVAPEELRDALTGVYSDLMLNRQAYGAAFSPQAAPESPEQVAAALRAWLDEHFGEDVNLNLIASALGYSPSHLTKVFQKRYYMSPIKYLTRVRMAKARYCLMYRGDLSIRQIGEMVGYEEQGYFSRMFKKTHGLSPVEFRASPQRWSHRPFP